MEMFSNLVLSHLLLSWIVCSLNIFVSGEVHIDLPLGVRNNGDLVVDAGSNFTLTCRGDIPLAWTYNDYSDEEKSKKTVTVSNEHGQEVAELTVTGAYYQDTGYFTCYPRNESHTSPRAQQIYVFVRDPNHYFAGNESMSFQEAHYPGSTVIPCRVTDPDLNVTLEKDGSVVSGIKYDPHEGFEINVIGVHDSGAYSCEINGQIYELLLQVEFMTADVTLETPHVEISPQPVIEGGNANLTCTLHYEPNHRFDIYWIVPHPHVNESGRLNESVYIVKDDKGERNAAHRILTLADVTKKDEGTYICKVVDHNHNNKTKSIELKVSPPGHRYVNLTIRGHNNGSEIVIEPGVNEAQVLVDIRAHPQPKLVQWFDKKHRPIMGKGEDYTVNNNNNEAQLYIHRPRAEMSGTYTLMVDNGHINDNVFINLLVKGGPGLKVNHGKDQAFYMVNRSHEIDCEVFANPEPNITWYFRPCPDYPSCSSNFTLIDQQNYNELGIVSESAFKSTVRLIPESTGELECRACNVFNCKKEKTVMLLTDVEGGMAIESPAYVVVGDTVTLGCGASKYKYLDNIVWEKKENGTPPEIVKDLEMLIGESKYSYFKNLTIPHVTKKQAGEYICSARLRYVRENTFHAEVFNLDVKDRMKPMILKKNITTELSVQTGKEVILNCHILNGSPPPKIVWYMNGEMVQMNHKNIMLEEDSRILKIRGAGINHKGEYVCNATNKVGYDTITFNINIKDIQYFFWILSIVGGLLFITVCGAGVFYWFKVRKYKSEIDELNQLKKLGLEHFQKGKKECINPKLNISEQADLLPYDSQKWEFPRDKLKLGAVLGSGAFGLVLKAEAYEIVEEGVATTVAVKMVKNKDNVSTIHALASELKIMIHLGKHVNVVNVLGACTGDLTKGELLVIVEYCRYGNLRKYLHDHRGTFINQVNPHTGQFDSTFIEPMSPGSISNRFSYSNGRAYDSAALSQTTASTMVMSDMSVRDSETTPVGEDGYLVSKDHEWRPQDRKDDNGVGGLRPVCTQDLICWGFQIARGMEYLASRKVLHGDLAARNILLADDNIVKICDFGLSKTVYKYNDYKKKGEEPLPYKWMAIESIRDKVFSTQSDVWSYGITMWELFTLANTPYPGMEAVSGLYDKLVEGYRMEKPKYATKQIYEVMRDCWHENPHSRPSFTELAERMGGMLEDTVRTHYVDLNDPYLHHNSEYLAQQDYLSMLQSPSYVNWNSGYTAMQPASPRSEVSMEMMPMLSPGGQVKLDSESLNPLSPQAVLPANESDLPDGAEKSPIARTKARGNDYVNVTQVLGFSNPNYQNLGRPKKSPYVNVSDV